MDATSTPTTDRPGASAGWPVIVCCAIYILALIGAGLLARRSVPAEMAVGPPMLIFGMVGSVYAVRVYRHRGLDRRTRRAWAIVAGAFIPMALTPALYAMFPAETFPVPGDLARIAFTLMLLAALLTLPRQGGGRYRRKLALDVATVLASGAIILWYLAIGPVADAGYTLERAVMSLLYPLVDLVLLFGVATVLLHGTNRSTRRPLLLLATAGGCFIVGDTYVSFQVAHPAASEVVAIWPMLSYLTAHFLIAVAACEQLRRIRPGVSTDAGDRPTAAGTRLPYVAVALGSCLLLVAASAEPRVYPWGGLVLGAVAVTGLVVARQVMVQRESHRMAVTDGLTGLANRSQLYEVLTRTVARGSRTGRRCAVVLADMNGFKQVNDTMGHHAGDQLLVAFGEALRRSALGSDLVARLGGDEFAVVLTDIDGADDASAVMRRIRTAMRGPVPIDGEPVSMRASFGVAVCEPGQLTPEQVIHRADAAMYQAKRTGNDSWVFYQPGMDGAGTTPLEVDLRGAVAAGQLQVWYQPIVALMDGRVLGVEALVRWAHPERGLLQPADFLGTAERIGMSGEIDRWVLEHACRQAQQWQRPERPSPYLCVNLAATTPQDPDFARTALEVLDRTGFDPRQLVLEVPDQSVLTGEVIPQLQALRAAGVRIALDDLGLDLASLQDITGQPVDMLKLDRSFVVMLDGDAQRSAVAEAVLRLGEALHIDAVAEGVENDTQARELLLLGCGTAQGYHFARPMTSVAMQAFIAASANRADAVIDGLSAPAVAIGR